MYVIVIASGRKTVGGSGLIRPLRRGRIGAKKKFNEPVIAP